MWEALRKLPLLFFLAGLPVTNTTIYCAQWMVHVSLVNTQGNPKGWLHCNSHFTEKKKTLGFQEMLCALLPQGLIAGIRVQNVALDPTLSCHVTELTHLLLSPETASTREVPLWTHCLQRPFLHPS